jgi:hypothetical protein
MNERLGGFLVLVGILAAVLILGMVTAHVTLRRSDGSLKTTWAEYNEVVGKTFKWNGNDILVTGYGRDGAYDMVILSTNPHQSPITVRGDRKQVFEAYKASLPPEAAVEKPKQSF